MTPPPVSRALHELAVVGKEIPKADAGSKVTAQAQYIHDLELPGMLWGRIKYSDRASARIVSIDTSAAEAMPGVKSVITAYNTPELRIGFIKDNTVLKKDRVRQYRDEVAAVAATSREIAEAAIAAITVEYEDLPAVFDVDEALLPDAPLVHDTDAKGEPVKDNRLRLPWKFNHGDIEAGEAASAFVAEGEYETGWVTHICMGTSGCIASFDTDENLTMYSVTQIPSLAKADFHEALKTWGIPGNVRVVNSVVGGGFGSKLDTYAFEYIAILLAHRTRRPVKILFDREEEFIATSPRQPFKMKIRQGCDAEGRLTFRDVTCLLDNGAYTSWGATTPSVAMMPAVNLYRVPNVRFKATCVYTNNTYSQAMRGYGTPQITFALECNMDELAEKAGIDPYDLRLRNANRSGEVTPQGFLATTCGHKECLEEVATRLAVEGEAGEDSGRRDRRHDPGVDRRRRRQRGCTGRRFHQEARCRHGLPDARRRRRQDLQVRRLRHADQGRRLRQDRRLLGLDGHRPGPRHRPAADRGRDAGRQDLGRQRGHRRHRRLPVGRGRARLALDLHRRECGAGRRPPGARADPAVRGRSPGRTGGSPRSAGRQDRRPRRTPRRPRPWTACCARPTSPGAIPPCSWRPTSTSRPPTCPPPT